MRYDIYSIYKIHFEVNFEPWAGVAAGSCCWPCCGRSCRGRRRSAAVRSGCGWTWSRPGAAHSPRGSNSEPGPPPGAAAESSGRTQTSLPAEREGERGRERERDMWRVKTYFRCYLLHNIVTLKERTCKTSVSVWRKSCAPPVWIINYSKAFYYFHLFMPVCVWCVCVCSASSSDWDN